MLDETAVVDPPVATEPISPEFPELEETPAIEAQESAESETTEEPAPRTWNPDEWKDDETHKEWLDDLRREHHVQGQKQEYGRTQKVMESVKTQILDHAVLLETQVAGLAQAIQDAVALGDPAAIGRELAKNPDALRAYKEAMEASRNFRSVEEAFKFDDKIATDTSRDIAGAMTLIGKATGDEALAEPYIKRFLDEYRFTDDQGAATFTKFVRTALKAAEDKGFKRGLKAQGEVQTEAQKGAERSGKAPPATTGTAGGKPVDPDSISSNAWIAMPMEQREQIKTRWAEHVTRKR